MEDDKIIELFFARSEQAITELEKKYGAICRKVAGNILANRLDAEECVNDAYLGAWNTIPPRTPDPLLAYLCRIVRNLSIKKYHANTAKKRNSHYDAALDELAAYIPATATVESEYSAMELSKALDAFLDTLDAKNRVMFVRRYYFSDSIPDIARRFRTSSHNVSSRLSRTREKLKKFLKKEGYWNES